MQELYYEIEKTQKNLREFIIMNEAETAHKNQKEIQSPFKTNFFSNNLNTKNSPLKSKWVQFRSIQQQCLKSSQNLIQKKLDFFKIYTDILDLSKEIDFQCLKFQNSSQFSTINANPKPNLVEKIQKMVDNLMINAKFLRYNWDVQLIRELSLHGFTSQSIQKLMDHNIRKDVMKLITDAEFNEIGITNMGDKLILKKLILGSH